MQKRPYRIKLTNVAQVTLDDLSPDNPELVQWCGGKLRGLAETDPKDRAIELTHKRERVYAHAGDYIMELVGEFSVLSQAEIDTIGEFVE